MPDSHLLAAKNLTLSRRDDGALMFHLDGQTTPLATPKRALPLSDPDKFIVLCDEDGRELGVLRDVNELDAASQEVLREVLSRAYTITRITRVLEVEREALTGQTRWRVEIESDGSGANEPEEIPTVLEQLEPSANSSAPSATPSITLNGSSAATTLVAQNSDSNDASDSNGSEKDDTKILGRLRRRLRQDKSDDGEDAVDTEEREFLISGQEDVQTARYPHIYIVDTERNRYEIPDCEALDLESRRAAERFF